jgi:Protein of unknown function (DUF3307)
MQQVQTTFLAFLLAHLLGDFVFQTDRIVLAKERFRGYAEHGAIHFALLIVCLTFARHEILAWRVQVLTVTYIVIHLIMDYGKHTLMKKRIVLDSSFAFVIDQGLHLATIVLFVFAMEQLTWGSVLSRFNWSMETRERVLATSVVYTATVFAGGYLIRYLTRSIASHVQSESGETEQELRNAGMYIGWLERFLVISAVIMQSPALVGLILTGKSIARFPELKQARFAEYFLIGTALSVSIALMGGLILAWVIHGTISLK